MSTELTEQLPVPPLASPPRGEPGEPIVTVISPTRGWQPVNWREIWRARELMYFLVWRNLKTRYKQTVLGGAWAILQPLATMAVFTVVLGRIAAAHTPTGEAAFPPYWLFLFTGLLPWTFFANTLGLASQSVVGGGSNLITKIYFPRIIIPVTSAGVPLIDLGVSFGILLVAMLVVGILPGWSILFVPLLVLALTVAALGLGILLSALAVAYRDVISVIPFVIQLWFFATPAIYLQNDSWIPPRWQNVVQPLLPLNPAQGLIVNFRQALLGGDFDYYALAVSLAVSLLLLVVGCFYFRRVEQTFADII